MAKIFAVVALVLALPQASVTPKPAVDVTAADIQATIQKEIASSTTDTPIRTIDAGGHNVSIAVVYRPKGAKGNAASHDKVTEVYDVLEGSGTLVTGGTMVNPQRRANTAEDVTQLSGPGVSATGIQGGVSRRIAKGDMLRLIDLEGEQAVDFLCYDAEDPTDRYCATNTVKVQGQLFVDKGTVLYSDLGKPLLTVTEDTCGRHDTIYGCCSEPNNFLRYGVRGTHSCFANFVEALAQFGLDRSYIVSNVNFFMSVPVAGDGAAVNVYGHSKAGNYVDLRAERDVLAVLSNCPQMHNPCNAYNLSPIRVIIWRPA